MKKSIYMYAPARGGNDTFLKFSSDQTAVREVWRWGEDNMLPTVLMSLSQSSTIHRRILNDKADYIAGRGFGVDEDNVRLKFMVENVNGRGESLRTVLQRVAFDKCLFGNAFVEVVTDEKRSFVSLFHQDASRCRLSRDKKSIVLHHDWSRFSKKEAEQVTLYPVFQRMADGTLRSIIHYKDYEPMTENYGIPKYIAALGAAAIVQKTDRWNVARLDNSFQPSGVMVLDGEVDSESEAAHIAKMAERKFAGRPGQVMFMIKNSVEGDTSKFIPLATNSDGDWRGLHDQATQDIVVAHSWFRTLSGLNYSTGFSADRIIYEYNIALNTIIKVEQQEIIEPIIYVIEELMGIDCSSLTFINRPPFEVKPSYMRVWEARKADGYEYDEEEADQQRFLSEI